METPTDTVGARFDVLESIAKHIAQIKPRMPERALICIGDFPTKILLKERLTEKTIDVLPIFIQKRSREIMKLTKSITVPHNILSVEPDADVHFWFNMNAYLSKNEACLAQLKGITNKFHEAIILVSLWEGLGSGMLPALVSQFKTVNANSVTLAILPSKAQPADAYFNALASLGMCTSNEYATVVLIGRDFAEDFLGVDRNGSRMIGNRIINYILEMMLEKETLPQELGELSRAFNVKLYTILSIPGVSFKVYGSFESILTAASLKPFLQFDLMTTEVLYILTRVPLNLKEDLTRAKIELATATWSKVIPNIKSIFVSEPIYIDDASDRVDLVVFAGGFDLTQLATSLMKKANRIKNEIVKKNLIKEKEWETVVKNLTMKE